MHFRRNFEKSFKGPSFHCQKFIDQTYFDVVELHRTFEIHDKKG